MPWGVAMRRMAGWGTSALVRGLARLVTLLCTPVRRGGRWLPAVVSGLLLVVLATQPAEAVIAEHATRAGAPVLPHQRGGSAAGLPHQTGSAVTQGAGSGKASKAAAVPGAVPSGTAPERPGTARLSYTGPKAAPGKTVNPPASVRADLLRSRTKATEPPAAEQGDPGLPGPAASGTEVTADRTADTSVFQNADGTLTARVYSRPVHYRAAGGGWADIDTTLAQGSDGRWAERADSPSASFAADGGDTSLVSYGPGADEKVSYGLQGAKAVQGKASASSITYPGIAASSDLTYEATASGVKETLTLHDASAPTTWLFPLHLTGLTASLASNGSVEFTDSSGAVRETIPHGFMEDAARGAVSGDGAISTGVEYSLTTTADGEPALRVSLDSAWLHSADRVFPVKVDPTNLNAASSTYVETPYDINFSTEDTLKVGSYDGGSHKALSYLLFGSFGSTFKNDYIEKASLDLDDVWSGGCTAEPVDAHAITSSWSVGSIAAYPGLSYGSTIGTSSFAAGSSCGGSAWHGIDIGDNPSAAGVKLLEGWAHGGANHGIALTASTSTVAAWKQFASVNSSYPPYLSVTYSSYGADYSIPKQTYTEPTDSAKGSMKVTVTNRGTAAWSTSANKLAADIYSTSWAKLTTNATETAVPSAVAANATVTMTGSIPALAPGQYYVCWDMLNGSTSFYTSYAVPEVCSEITSADTPPQIDSMSPPGDSVLGSISPQLATSGHDPDSFPGSALTYDFQVYTNPSSGTPAMVADSGWVSTKQWTVPVGDLAWNQSYYWIVADSDGDAASAWSDASPFSTAVPQPLITSHLGAGAGSDSGRSFDPQVGDYTTSATDASVAAVGPALDVSRTYNSLDPRTSLLFGAGWSSRYDMTAQPDNDSSGGVVVTGADGRQERFGRNSFELDQIAGVGDQTGDGVDDAVAVDQSTGKLWLYKGPDYSALSRMQIGNAGWNGMKWLTGGDVNGDGIGDLIGVHTADATLRMYPGTAGGGLGTPVQIGNAGWNGMANLALTGPLGSDGKKDLVASEISTGELWAYPVNSDGTLGTRIEIGDGGWNGMTELMGGDFNGDGHGDVVGVEISTGKLWLYPSYGSNALGTRVQIGSSWGQMEDLAPVSGISGDGTVDFLATLKSSGVRYLYHSGASFVANTSYAGPTRTPTAMAVYTPAAGEFETFGPLAGAAGGWELQDKSGTTYTFGQQAGAVWKLTRITDRHNRAETLGYNTDGTLATVTNAVSGRTLHFTWSGGHVTQVATDPDKAGDPPATWTYSYSGDDLTEVCPPTSTTACTAYSYTGGSSSGSHYRSAVLDANPSSYWRLTESSGTAAASEVAVNEGTDAGKYSASGVTLGAAGPLPGSPTTAATFNGTGYVTVPSAGLHENTDGRAVSLWFKTSSEGVLIGDQSVSVSGATAASGSWTPVLYVGSDGKLHGHWWSVSGSGGTAFGSASAVNDNTWHHAVLSSDGTTQTLYLDGTAQDTFTGLPNDQANTTTYIGAGFTTTWVDSPGAVSYFTGQIAEVAFYAHPLGAPAVQQQYAAGSSPARELTSVTLPSGKTRMAATYDAARDRASQVTDANGGTWKLGVPSTTGSGSYYHGAVLTDAPFDYWPLSDSSGAQAANAVSTTNAITFGSDGDAAYHNVTLGVGGPFSGGTETAAQFDGTSSYTSLPQEVFPFYGGSGEAALSIELWFKTSTAGETLFSYQSGPIGTALSAQYTPALYIGADGHLYGEFWDGYLSPMESTASVDDGAWHQAVLTVDLDDQETLNVDGQQVDTRSGSDIQFTQPYVSLGAGYLSGDWPSLPGANPQGYFKGSLAQVSFYDEALDTAAVADHYAARGAASGSTPVTAATVTDPAGKAITYRYDAGHNERLLSTTNALGQTSSYGYDSDGYPSSTADPDGTVTALTYNTRGDVLSQTTRDSFGSVTGYYAYPADGTYGVTDPRADEPTSYADPRSSGPSDTTYATAYTYSAKGDLLTSTDPDGNRSVETYTDGTEPATDGGTEPAGLLATSKDADGNTTNYSYDASGDLARVTAPTGSATSYGYDALGRRVTATQVSDTYPDGVTTSYAYDPDNRLAGQTGPATTDAVAGTTHTPQVSYAYDDDSDVTTQTLADTTGGDDPRTTSWTYNDHDQVKEVTDPAGRKTAYGYDGYGNLAERTDPGGDDYRFDYSPTGELLTTTLTNYTADPVSPSSATALVLDSRAYDPAGLLSTDTDSMGRTTKFYYDEEHRMTASWLEYRNDDGSTSDKELQQYDYDDAGHVVTSWRTDDDIETDYTVDPAGRTTGELFDPDNLNTSTASTYDPDGNVTSRSVTPGTPDGPGDGPATDRTDYAYNALGEVTATTVHNGSDTLVTSSTYDQRGALTSTTDPRGNTPGATAADHTTTYTTDEAGRVTQVVEPVVSAESNGGTAQQVHPITLHGYDTFGDETSTDDPDGNITTYTYDADGEQTAASAPAYTPPGSTTPITPTATAEYDATGKLKTVTDELHQVTHYTYDQFGDLAQIQEPPVDGHTPTTHAIYDTDGETLQVTDPTGAVSAATYDDLGQTQTMSQAVRQPTPTTATTTFGYDGAGNQTSVSLPGGETYTAEYDHAGDQTSATDPLGHTTDYTYDVEGRLTSTTLPDGTATTRTYDEAGRLTDTASLDATGGTLTHSSFAYDAADDPVAATDADQHTTDYAYDALGDLVKQTEPVTSTSSITTTFGYDAAGNATRYTDGDGNATITTYNTLGLAESSVEPATSAFPNASDRTTTVAYGADGQPRTITRPGGVTLTDTYDADGRLTAQTGTGAEAATADRTFGYDADGRLTSTSAPGGTNTYTYDDRGDILSAAGPSGTASYAYNSDGLLSSRTDKAGTAAYTYNGDGQVKTASDPLTSANLTYGYNEVGQVNDISYGDAAADQSISYDAQHRLTDDTLTAPDGTTEASASYGYDDAGLVTSQTTAGTAGAGAQTYAYDDSGRLTSWTNGSATTGYGYDDAGNRTSVTAGGTTTTASYNARDQLTGTTGGSATTSYAYSPRGTMSSVTGSSGTENLSYDAFDQLTSDGTTSYSHDALGRLATAGSSTFSYDGTGGSIVSDGTETYGRGAQGDLISVGGSGGAALAYANQHGDLTGTFTATGTGLAGSTAYDPFGQTTATAGTQADLGYQEGWTDPASNRVATGSRWYDPSTGDFTSQDATSQAPFPSAAANPYAYGADDPVDNADPSGDSSCSSSPYHAPSPTPSGSPVSGSNYSAELARWANTLARWYGYLQVAYSIGRGLLSALGSMHATSGGSHTSTLTKIRNAVGSVNSSVSSSVGGGALGKAAGMTAAGVVLLGFGAAFAGYGSCDVSATRYTPPPPRRPRPRQDCTRTRARGRPARPPAPEPPRSPAPRPRTLARGWSPRSHRPVRPPPERPTHLRPAPPRPRPRR